MRAGPPPRIGRSVCHRSCPLGFDAGAPVCACSRPSYSPLFALRHRGPLLSSVLRRPTCLSGPSLVAAETAPAVRRARLLDRSQQDAAFGHCRTLQRQLHWPAVALLRSFVRGRCPTSSCAHGGWLVLRCCYVQYQHFAELSFRRVCRGSFSPLSGADYAGR